MNLKHTLVAAAMACAGTAATAVPGSLGTLQNQTVAVSNSFSAGAGDFVDVYTFTLTGLASTIFGDIDRANSGSLWKIVDFKLKLKDDNGGPVYKDNSPGNGFSFENLIAGTYTLRLTGTVNGSRGGSYTGFVSEVSPVPEPSTYALVLAGLGVVGFVARRRRPQ